MLFYLGILPKKLYNKIHFTGLFAELDILIKDKVTYKSFTKHFLYTFSML